MVILHAGWHPQRGLGIRPAPVLPPAASLRPAFLAREETYGNHPLPRVVMGVVVGIVVGALRKPSTPHATHPVACTRGQIEAAGRLRRPAMRPHTPHPAQLVPLTRLVAARLSSREAS
jgi:hypothetical protein